MSRLTLKYARNGALAGIGLYTVIAATLLALSMSVGSARTASTSDASLNLLPQIGQVVGALLKS
ncbi:hypothetical protein [Pseudomonas indica]|uniref:Uncharacterized protein n=1 Tax=Pseudomonas indica TaxID=137658 RepID=A0A1G9KZY4_9PSED|nr:hypothetical protein [Pseudomonas indica]SDL55073.1 hypothetical protein SAMN05216186_12373 [Pseudomonas indica]